MTLGFDPAPRVVFRRNPLNVVVMQLRFPPILTLAQPAGIALFQEAIRHEYPRAEAPAQQVTFGVGPAGPIPPQIQQGPWRFHGESGWLVALAPDFVSLEATKYERYEDFRFRAERLLSVARDDIGVTERSRIGLRYVNEIRHPSASTIKDWRPLLDQQLLGVAAGDLLGDRVVQTLQQVDIRLDSGQLTVRHGWHEAPDGQAPYVIDLDAYDDSSLPFDVDQVLELVDAYRRVIGDFFRSSLSPELYDFLEPTEPEGRP